MHPVSSIRLASSIILTRGSDADPEIYLVKRAPELRFMGGYWAFPGGTVIQEDYQADDSPLDQVLSGCALREWFEETGVLVGRLAKQLAKLDRANIRQQLLDGASLQAWYTLSSSESFYPVASRSLLAGHIKLEEDGICKKSRQGWLLCH